MIGGTTKVTGNTELLLCLAEAIFGTAWDGKSCGRSGPHQVEVRNWNFDYTSAARTLTHVITKRLSRMQQQSPAVGWLSSILGSRLSMRTKPNGL